MKLEKIEIKGSGREGCCWRSRSVPRETQCAVPGTGDAVRQATRLAAAFRVFASVLPTFSVCRPRAYEVEARSTDVRGK